MGYKYLNMENYKRKNHFEYFNSLAYPYVGLTANVDITALWEKVRVEKLPFFLTVCYFVSKAANGVPELRQRIAEGKIIEYDNCRTSHTVALEDGTYCYCNLDGNKPFEEFIPYAIGDQEEAKQRKSIEEEKDETCDMLFISTLPWISYTSLVQPVPMPADSNPRITWGKCFEQGGRMLLPVSLLANHALVDGKHIADFYRLLDGHIQLVKFP